MKKITEAEKEKILDLYYNKHLNYTAIGKEMNRSRVFVSNVIKKEIEKSGIEVKAFKIIAPKSDKKRNILYLPNSYIEGIGLDLKAKSKSIIMSLDKNKEEIIIKKNENS